MTRPAVIHHFGSKDGLWDEDPAGAVPLPVQGNRTALDDMSEVGAADGRAHPPRRGDKTTQR